MSDIFLSYASEDRERAAELAETLKACGWEVWWDRTLVAGDRYAAVIAEQLATAGCVIVLWSQRSVASDWVADEANEAKARDVYLPVCLDGTQPPLGFRGSQYADLSGWDGSLEDHGFQRLLGGIRRHVPAKGSAVPSPPGGIWQRLIDAVGRKRWRSAPVRLAMAALPMVALAVSLAVLGTSPRPAQIRLGLTVSQATLIFRDAVDRGVVTSYPTSTLTVVGFQNADLGFAALGSAEPKLGPGRVRLFAAEPPATATFNDVQCEGVGLPPGSRVTLGWRDGSLHLTAWETSLAVNFSTQPHLTLACDGCAVASGEQDPVPLTASAPYTFAFANSQIVSIDSESPGMSLTLDAPVGSVPMAGNIVVEKMEFTDMGDDGRPASSILSGQLDYQGLSRPTRHLRDGEFVVAGSLENFYLTRVVVDAEGLNLEMHGQVGRLDVGGAGSIRSQLPSRLEEGMSQSPWVLYAGAVFAVGTLAVGILGVSRRRSRL